MGRGGDCETLKGREGIKDLVVSRRCLDGLWSNVDLPLAMDSVTLN